MKLEEALARAERREKLVGRVAVTSFAIAFVLMFVGGEEWLGAFDPWDRDATVVSVTLGVIYGIAAVLFWGSLRLFGTRLLAAAGGKRFHRDIRNSTTRRLCWGQLNRWCAEKAFRIRSLLKDDR